MEIIKSMFTAQNLKMGAIVGGGVAGAYALTSHYTENKYAHGAAILLGAMLALPLASKFGK